ncbi:PspA/IM30 family protein [Solimonas sp. K1W22B-7]|uniref:PspA/IM30 family protein n=1 Tax=Solimonas sp. K1W22B-7 TaxID=2303331 RepID=UPI000E33167D|nr:PspA/IM30 family protein [Solimonas sp. K1W22B-7]AXQ30935.1 PspA/IM30 family protein [Solimonas sp. K1W22B-7]
MPSLFYRIRSLVTAQAHHQIDEIENPQVMAHQVLRELGDDLQQANQALVISLGAEKQLQRQREAAGSEAADWELKAERLLKAGDEDKTRSALERAVQMRSRAQALETPLAAAQRATVRLREQVQRLKSELETARGRAAIISANQTAANALGSAARASDSYTRAMDRAQQMDRLSQKAARFESEAEAAAELLNEDGRFEREVAQVDLGVEVAARMAELKARLAGDSVPPSN